jgi:hypothetical protein
VFCHGPSLSSPALHPRPPTYLTHSPMVGPPLLSSSCCLPACTSPCTAVYVCVGCEDGYGVWPLNSQQSATAEGWTARYVKSFTCQPCGPNQVPFLPGSNVLAAWDGSDWTLQCQDNTRGIRSGNMGSQGGNSVGLDASGGATDGATPSYEHSGTPTPPSDAGRSAGSPPVAYAPKPPAPGAQNSEAPAPTSDSAVSSDAAASAPSKGWSKPNTLGRRLAKFGDASLAVNSVVESATAMPLGRPTEPPVVTAAQTGTQPSASKYISRCETGNLFLNCPAELKSWMQLQVFDTCLLDANHVLNTSDCAPAADGVEDWFQSGMRGQATKDGVSAASHNTYMNAPWWPGQCVDCALVGGTEDPTGTYCGEGILKS